jgi:hypothetical protein
MPRGTVRRAGALLCTALFCPIGHSALGSRLQKDYPVVMGDHCDTRCFWRQGESRFDAAIAPRRPERVAGTMHRMG